jgi:DNA-binding transcriptional MerR regulator
MLKISDFSRLTFVPAKTLRYYDEIGLFQPQHVDRFTGYRYYDMGQLPRLNRILALKALGLSLEQIKQVLDDGLTAEQIRGMLRLKQAEAQQRMREEQQRLLYIESKLRQIEQEGKMSDHDVILKRIPVVHAASIRGIARTQELMTPLLNEMFDTLAKHIYAHGKMSDKPEECGITIFPDAEWSGENIQLEAAFGIISVLPETDRIHMVTLPEIEQAACVAHHGPFTTLGDSYTALTQWIGSNEYDIVGPNREVNLAYDRDGDPNLWVTELQFPVRKREK